MGGHEYGHAAVAATRRPGSDVGVGTVATGVVASPLLAVVGTVATGVAGTLSDTDIDSSFVDIVMVYSKE